MFTCALFLYSNSLLSGVWTTGHMGVVSQTDHTPFLKVLNSYWFNISHIVCVIFVCIFFCLCSSYSAVMGEIFLTSPHMCNVTSGMMEYDFISTIHPCSTVWKWLALWPHIKKVPVWRCGASSCACTGAIDSSHSPKTVVLFVNLNCPWMRGRWSA